MIYGRMPSLNCGGSLSRMLVRNIWGHERFRRIWLDRSGFSALGVEVLLNNLILHLANESQTENIGSHLQTVAKTSFSLAISAWLLGVRQIVLKQVLETADFD